MPGFLTGPRNGFVDRMKGKGMCSSGFLTQVGNSAALVAGSGNAAVYSSSTGVSPGTTNNDNVLVSWVIPANMFDIGGRGLQVTAMGSVANNVNSKRLKIIIGCTTAVIGSAVTGGTTIADSGAYTTTGAAGWQIAAQVFKTGAGGSNTQIALHQSSTIGNTNGTLVVPSALTLTETGSVLLAVTGNAVTTATDIVMNFAELFVTN